MTLTVLGRLHALTARAFTAALTAILGHKLGDKKKKRKIVHNGGWRYPATNGHINARTHTRRQSTWMNCTINSDREQKYFRTTAKERHWLHGCNRPKGWRQPQKIVSLDAATTMTTTTDKNKCIDNIFCWPKKQAAEQIDLRVSSPSRSDNNNNKSLAPQQHKNDQNTARMLIGFKDTLCRFSFNLHCGFFCECVERPLRTFGLSPMSPSPTISFIVIAIILAVQQTASFGVVSRTVLPWHRMPAKWTIRNTMQHLQRMCADCVHLSLPSIIQLHCKSRGCACCL